MLPLIFGLFGFPTVFLTLIVFVYMRNLVRLRRASFVRHISFVVRRNLPLVSSMYLSSVGEPAGLRYPLRHLSRMLELGIPLSDAIGIVWPRCPRVDRSILQVAEQSGSLPDAIAVIDARYQRDIESRLNNEQRSLVIPALTFVVLLSTMLLAGVIIFPKFIVIFDDFGTPLPTFAHELFATGFMTGAIPSTWYGLLFHGTIALVIALVALRAIAFIFSGPLYRSDWYNNIVDSIRWAIPILRRAAKAEACVATLPTIRIAASAGWPLEQAIDLAASVKTNVVWRQRLQDWANGIRQGSDTIAAGRKAGLPDMLMRYLSVGIRDADLEAPLHAAEQYFTLLLERQQRAIRLALSISATLITGALVCGLCLTVILSIVDILDTTALQWWVI